MAQDVTKLQKEICCLKEQIGDLRRRIARCCRPPVPGILRVEAVVIEFSSSTPTSLLTAGGLLAGNIIYDVKLVVENPFNGSPTVEIGTTLNTTLYSTVSENRLNEIWEGVYEDTNRLTAPCDFSVNWNQGGSTQGNGYAVALVLR